MGLCSGRTCGCALTSTEANIIGDGSASTPWIISGVGIGRMTEIERIALTGSDLFEGRYVHTTDAFRLWVRRNSKWMVLDEPPQAFTPVWSQGAGLVFTPDAGGAWYRRSGEVVTVSCSGSFGSTGAAGNGIQMAAPTIAGATIVGNGVGAWAYNRIGVSWYTGSLFAAGPTLVMSGDVANNQVFLGNTPNFAAASGHAVGLTYQSRIAYT